VVEIFHPVNTIVAIQAGSSKELNMLIHEYTIMISVAATTGAHLKTLHTIQMTAQAGHRLPGIILSMPRQAETGL
jgi:hypothetical protein